VKRPEQEIHKAVVAHLNARAEPDVFYFHPANGGKRTAFEGRLFKALGVVAGVPDLIFCKGGRMYALELKAPKGRLTASQRECQAALKHCKANVWTAEGLDEALCVLESWGILKRNVASASNSTAGEDNDRDGTQQQRSTEEYRGAY
jgi:hypothetical protein